MRDKPQKKISQRKQMKKGEGQEKIMQETWLFGERTHSLANSEWSCSPVLWESKKLIPFDIECCPVFSLKHGIAQRYTIHSCIWGFLALG